MNARRPRQRRVAAMLAACMLAASGSGLAQGYPTRSIRWIVTSSPGGAFDLISRALAVPMSAGMGQPLVIDNRPGAGGIVGLEFVARAAPDGYTVLTSGLSQIVLERYFHEKLPYDPQRDFAPIGSIGDLAFALHVHTSVPVRTLKELIDYSKANPGKLYYGSAGIGHSFHLATEILKQRTGADLTHVPYKGTAPGLKDLFAGRIQVMFYPPSGQILSQMRAGVIRPLAAASHRRLPDLPDVPTFQEAGIEAYSVATWVGLFAPAGTPKEVVARLNRELNRASSSPEAQKGYEAISMLPNTSTPEELVQRISRDTPLWGTVIKSLGIKPEK
jgi:tripartite-type tricarboxylate transporter receptor subunit TctC